MRRIWQTAIATVATAAAVAVPAAAHADSVQASCSFDGKNLPTHCGVAFLYGGGTVTVDADVVATVNDTKNPPSWHIANSDTYTVPCHAAFAATDPAASWKCTLPAGRYYLFVTTDHIGQPGFADVRW
jgi:hypothetical protein